MHTPICLRVGPRWTQGPLRRGHRANSLPDDVTLRSSPRVRDGPRNPAQHDSVSGPEHVRGTGHSWGEDSRLVAGGHFPGRKTSNNRAPWPTVRPNVPEGAFRAIAWTGAPVITQVEPARMTRTSTPS